MCLVQPMMGGVSYFVSQQSGSNSNSGMLPSSPFASVDRAVNFVQPGDTIFLMGNFTNPSYSSTISLSTPLDDPRFWHGENTIRIANLHGTSGNYITFKAYDGNTLLKGDGGNIFRVQNCSYLRIEGFTIEGEVNNIPLALANALQFVYILNTASSLSDPAPADLNYRDQDCVSNCVPNAIVDGEEYSALNPNKVYRPTYYDTRGMYLSDVHHIDILSNHIHHMPGGGLRVSDCEDILIQENEVNDCSRRSSGGTHGLVVTKATSTRTTDDYRIKIVANKVHHNYNEQYSWAPDKIIITPHIDEGKGISLQRNQTTYNSSGTILVNWENGRILIENNICYMNGYSGIHSNDGYRIDIINNTCYFNSYTGSFTIGGTNPNGGNIGISLQGGTGHKIINNISVIDNNMTRSAISTDITAPGALFVKDNIIYGTTGPILTDPEIDAIQINMLMSDPQFVNAAAFDFTILPSSPAINQADDNYAPATDYSGAARVLPDIGAMEYVAALPIELLDFSVINQKTQVLLQWVTASETSNRQFVVEHSADARNWVAIGEIGGNGTTTVQNNYEFWDEKPIIGLNYYRLKQVNLDESFFFSPIRSVIVGKETSSVMVYPNPFTASIWVANAKSADLIQVFDSVGRLVMSQSVVGETAFTELNLESLNYNSLYFLKVGQETVKVFKL